MNQEGSTWKYEKIFFTLQNLCGSSVYMAETINKVFCWLFILEVENLCLSDSQYN